MKIEKIETDKIKVTVFSEDLEMFNLNIKRIKPDSPELRIFLCEIMKKVQLETNFDPFDGQVIVEATPCGEELILMVSKLTEKRKIDRTKIKNVRAVKKQPEKYIYRFDDFNAVCDCIKNVSVHNYEIGELYSMDNSYFLTFEADKFNINLGEFAGMCRKGEVCYSYLAEYGKLVASGKKLCNIAEFLKSE